MPLLLGGIVIWSGSTLDIPNGWQICDGTNGTPNLRNRFIIGAGDLFNVNDNGGSKDSELVSHTHTVTTNSNSHTHTFPASNTSTSFSFESIAQGSGTATNAVTSSNGAHTHTLENISTPGESGVNKNLPPYYALCYIQQIS
jgi:microcystin-dependent protein